MKRILSIATAAFLILTLALPVFAGPEGQSKGEVPQIDKGVITVDGQKDDIYDSGLKVEVNVPKPDLDVTQSHATAYMLWAEGSWYLFMDVTDADIQEALAEHQQNHPWNTDSVEMFFDFGNQHDDLVKQYRVDYTGWPSYYEEDGAASAYGPDAATSYFDDYAVSRDAEGYNIEMRINLTKYNLTEGDAIGIQIQLNDMAGDKTDSPTAVFNMAASQNPTSWEAEKYDYIILGKKIAVETAAPETQAPAAAPATPAAPATADMGILAAAAILAASAGIVLAGKKR